MIEFKQIIGRGTRLFEGKTYFTILDFVGASFQFADPEWDGDPLIPTEEITEAMNKNDEKDTKKEEDDTRTLRESGEET